MNTYTCGKCNQLLPASEFHSDTSTKGHYSICKRCRSHNPSRILNGLVSNARRRAAKRNLPCTIDMDYILDLNEKQNGLCAYTNLPLNWDVWSCGTQRVCPFDRVSIDRINPQYGYVPGNVQLVTDFVNRIKAWYPENDFVEFCRLVVTTFDANNKAAS